MGCQKRDRGDRGMAYGIELPLHESVQRAIQRAVNSVSRVVTYQSNETKLLCVRRGDNIVVLCRQPANKYGERYLVFSAYLPHPERYNKIRPAVHVEFYKTGRDAWRRFRYEIRMIEKKRRQRT